MQPHNPPNEETSAPGGTFGISFSPFLLQSTHPAAALGLCITTGIEREAVAFTIAEAQDREQKYGRTHASPKIIIQLRLRPSLLVSPSQSWRRPLPLGIIISGVTLPSLCPICRMPQEWHISLYFSICSV